MSYEELKPLIWGEALADFIMREGMPNYYFTRAFFWAVNEVMMAVYKERRDRFFNVTEAPPAKAPALA